MLKSEWVWQSLNNRMFGLLILSGVMLLSGVYHADLGISLGFGAADSLPVHNVNTGLNYSSIQAAVDASETLNGHTIAVDAGTYAEIVVVNKSLAINGAGRDVTVIDGGGGGPVIHVLADDVVVSGFEVRNGFLGITVDHSANCLLSDNRVTGIVDFYAVYASYSTNCTIRRNVVGPNSASGVLVTNSVGFTMSENHAFSNTGYGLNANASMNGMVSWNDAVDNYFDGIGLGSGSSNCTVFGNNVSGNQLFGVWLDKDCFGNLIYENDIVGNGIQVSVSLANGWDNGFEGNYWSSHTGPDSDRNGIIDVPLVIGDGNVDNFPLAGEFRSFETSYGFRVNVASNSTVESFSFFEPNGTVRFTIQTSLTSQDYGFFRMSIPHGLIVEPFNVSVDEKSPSYVNYSLYDDGFSRWIYFDFQNLQHEVSVQGVDRTIPTVSVLTPESKMYDTGSIQLVLVVNELVSWMAYSLDSQGNVTVNGNLTIEGVSNGTHYIVVYSRDLAGNTGASNIVSFSVNIPENPFIYWALPLVAAVAVVLILFFIRFRKSKHKAPKPGG